MPAPLPPLPSPCSVVVVGVSGALKLTLGCSANSTLLGALITARRAWRGVTPALATADLGAACRPSCAARTIDSGLPPVRRAKLAVRCSTGSPSPPASREPELQVALSPAARQRQAEPRTERNLAPAGSRSVRRTREPVLAAPLFQTRTLNRPVPPAVGTSTV